MSGPLGLEPIVSPPKRDHGGIRARGFRSVPAPAPEWAIDTFRKELPPESASSLSIFALP